MSAERKAAAVVDQSALAAAAARRGPAPPEPIEPILDAGLGGPAPPHKAAAAPPRGAAAAPPAATAVAKCKSAAEIAIGESSSVFRRKLVDIEWQPINFTKDRHGSAMADAEECKTLEQHGLKLSGGVHRKCFYRLSDDKNAPTTLAFRPGTRGIWLSIAIDPGATPPFLLSYSLVVIVRQGHNEIKTESRTESVGTGSYLGISCPADACLHQVFIWTDKPDSAGARITEAKVFNSNFR